MAEKELAEYDKPKYSLKDMYWFGGRVAVATFVVAGIYFQFLQMKKVQEIEHQEVKTEIKNANGRIDRKHNAQDSSFKTAIRLIYRELDKKQDKPTK